jgi:hypothetical protein
MANLTEGTGTNEASNGEASKETERQIEIANQLERALSFLRTTSRTNDYFTGYSLNEMLKERIDLIGPTDDKVETRVGDSEKSTLIAVLNTFLAATVGEGPKHEGGAIQSALDLDYIQNLSSEQTEAVND